MNLHIFWLVFVVYNNNYFFKFSYTDMEPDGGISLEHHIIDM